MKIVVLSRSERLYSTARLVEAGRERGHEVRVVDHTQCWVDVKTSYPSVYLRDERLVGIDAIIPRVGPSVTGYGASIVRQFETMGTFTTLRSIALVRSRDKLRSLQLLASAGVDIPKTVFANRASDVNRVLEQINGPPAVIKLVEGTQGKGVLLAETKTGVKSLVEAFASLDANILVQEFIRESRGTDIRVFVVGGKVAGAMRREAPPGEFRANIHQGGTAQAIRLGAAQKRTALKAARTLGLQVAGVDLIQSARGPLVLEVNPSPGLEGIESATGKDVAGRIIDYIATQQPKKRQKDRVGA